MKNRKIKFRAWQEGMLCQEKHGVYGLKSFLNQLYEDCILMQYTGFKDKNGKEIYEGDIVRAIGDRNRYPEDSRVARVSYSNDLQFVLASSDTGTFGMPMTWGGYESLEVVGNVYENPELLK